MNTQLYDLYSSKWDRLSKHMKELSQSDQYAEKPTNPLLLSTNKQSNYTNADIRIMIFGQETNSWYGDFNGDIRKVQKLYDDFFATGYCFKYGGYFWNAIKLFRNEIRNRFPEKSIDLLWNNVVKVGKSGSKGKPPKYIYEIEKKHFNVIPDEVKIMRPNLILFLSGPYYDSLIRNAFGEIDLKSIQGFKKRQLAEIQLPLPIKTFRTYHPNYLYKNNISKYFGEILTRL